MTNDPVKPATNGTATTPAPNGAGTGTSGKAAAAAVGTAPISKKDLLDEAMEKYDRVLARFGTAEKAQAFLDAAGRESSPLKAQHADDRAAWADRAREMGKEHSHDMSLRDMGPLNLPDRPPGYGAAYLKEDWELSAIGDADNPAELKPDAWKIIMDGNRLLHGYAVQPNGTMARARFPAFVLKDGQETPHFEILDDSSIQIKETKGSTDTAMAAQGFSSTAIEAAVSGGFGGFGAAASGAFKTETATANSNASSSEKMQYTATYSFPRARIYLDELNLSISAVCEAELKALRDAARKLEADQSSPKKPDLIRAALACRQRLFDRFGHIFSTKMLLGGQLTATRSASSFGTISEAEKRDSMKLSAALSMDSKYVSASVSASHESADQVKTKTAIVQNASALTWNVRGGNTLLAANPVEWSNSVCAFRTWRPLEQDGVCGLDDLITKITDTSGNQVWRDINHSLQVIEQNHFIADGPVQTGPARWDGRFFLEAPNGQMVRWDGDKLLLSKDTRPSDATAFRALNGDVAFENTPRPEMREFNADWPLILITAFTGTFYSREKDFGNQIPGVSVVSEGDRDGEICREVLAGGKDAINPKRKVCRWSFRLASSGKPDLKNPWNPRPASKWPTIQDGDNVRMYCHSYNFGTYKDVRTPPWLAPSVHWKPGTCDLKVLRYSTEDMRVTLWKGQSFNGVPLPLFGQPKDKVAVLGESRGAVQSYIDQYDRNVEPTDVAAKLENWRQLFAGRHFDVAKAFFSSTYPATQGRSWIPQVNTDQLFMDGVYGPSIENGINEAATAWKSKTGFTEEMVFTVRYFR